MDDSEARADTVVLEFKEDRPLTEVSLSLCHFLICCYMRVMASLTLRLTLLNL